MKFKNLEFTYIEQLINPISNKALMRSWKKIVWHIKSKQINYYILKFYRFVLREGLQRKSFVERSGAKIAAEYPTEFTKNVVVSGNVLNEGTPKKKSAFTADLIGM